MAPYDYMFGLSRATSCGYRNQVEDIGVLCRVAVVIDASLTLVALTCGSLLW